jgi:threonine dehydratase
MCIESRTTKRLFFKTENFQHTGSFKLRGAMSKLTSLASDMPVITASSGNHGIACSHAAMTTGHKLTVVLPENVAKLKLEKIQSYGTKTILNPGDSGMAEQKAQDLAAHGNYVYVSPYNDPLVMSGQGTIGLELLEQLPDIDNVFISMGGGGLISGIGSAIKVASPDTKIIGVSAINSAALAASIRAGKVVETEHLDTLADGCAGGVDNDSITLSIASEVVDKMVDCSEAEIERALRFIAWKENMIVEGAAGLALAGYLADEAEFEGEINVVLLCGANFDQAKIKAVLN